MVARGKHSNGGPSRGGIAKRRGAIRTDRDGDLVVTDASSRGRGGISKTRGSAASGRDSSTRHSRGGVNSERSQREILRHAGASDGSVKAPRGTHAPHRGLEELHITGWTSSKASTNSDGGRSTLIAWLEKKATMKNGASKRPVRVKKSRVEGDDLIISVNAEDVPVVKRMNGFVFSGANIKIEAGDKVEGDSSSGKESTVAMLKGVLARRYNMETKLLDLSGLGSDPDLKASAIFDSRSTTSKFFPALMKVLDQQFEHAAEKHEAVQSVSLANNELVNIAPVTTLSQTLPQLRNLDLSNNQISKLADIDTWKRRFSKLDHLVISNNPIEQSEPEYAQQLLTWYSKLRFLNSVQVRTDEEVAKSTQIGDLPFPIKTPSFQDEGQIAENFLRTFFVGYDTDRATLATHYYDDQSDFSFAVNTQAPRDPSGTENTVPQDWEQYIKRSRNLKKISHLPARQSRLYKGAKAVQEAWSLLPATRHPDLAAEAKKWLIECQSQPGIPDPTGQSTVGVDGFLITIHGEYEEIDANTAQTKKTRSFDRTFIIGPGGPSGVRVVNDMLTVRAYGGTQAFEPDNIETWTANNADPTAHPTLPEPALPTGLTPELAEQMVLEVQKRTAMTVGYAKDCLEQVQWDFEKALLAFEAVRASLPPEAFVQPQQQ